MKKSLLFLILFISVSMLFAETDNSLYSKVAEGSFKPTASYLTNTLSYRMYGNPAALASSKFMLELPSVSISAFNVAETISSPEVAKALENFSHFDFSDVKSDLMVVLLGLVQNIKSGYNSIAGADASFGFVSSGGFGLSFDAKAYINTMPVDGTSSSQSLLATAIVPVVDYAVSVGYGARLWENYNASTDESYFDIGFSAHWAMKLYSEQFTASTFVNYVDGTDSFDLETLPVRFGFSIPVDFGMIGGIFDGRLKLGLSFNNIFEASYSMKKYSGVSNAFKGNGGYDEYKISEPCTINMFVSYSPHWKVLNPTLTLSWDGIPCVEDSLTRTGDFTSDTDLYKYFTAKLDLQVLDFVNLDVAMRKGYLEVGSQIDLWIAHIGLRYGYHEAGDQYGEKPVDTFSISVKLGIDKN